MADGGGWRLFGKTPAQQGAERLLTTVTALARQPGFFAEARVSDTLDGRLELLFLHAALAMIRLRAAPEALKLSQVFTDRLFRHIDAGLREAGVGDLSVPRQMRKLASAFYGRLDAYGRALEAANRVALSAALARNIFNAEAAPFAAPLADYVAETAAALAAAPIGSLERLDAWRAAPG